MSMSDFLSDSLEGPVLEVDGFDKYDKYDNVKTKGSISDAAFVKDDNNFKGLMSYLKGCAMAVLGKPVSIVEAKGGAVAYTKCDSRRVTIGISRDGDFYDKATKEQGTVLRLGLLAHEVMHQIMTPFDYLKKVEKNMDDKTANVFHNIHNILEDPAIEHFAPKFIAGDVRKALSYVIKRCYNKAPRLEDAESPWTQYVNAMIMYGDMGPLKGDFTFPEAKQAFDETIDLFSQGIYEPKGEERVRIAQELTEKLRPLWEKYGESTDSSDKGNGFGSGGFPNPSRNDVDNYPSDHIDPEDMDASAKDALREKVKDLVKKAIEDSLNKTGKDKQSNEEVDKDKSSDEEPDGIPYKQNEQQFHEMSKSSDIFDNNTLFDENEADYELRKLINDAALEAESEYADLLDSVNKNLDESIRQQAENAHRNSDIQVPEGLPGLDEYKCRNEITVNGDSFEYDGLVRELEPLIDSLADRLEEIFRIDEREKILERKKSGSINLKRYYSPKLMTRVFDRRTNPQTKSKSNMCMALCIDHSGSMGGWSGSNESNILSATKTAILITEACNKLKHKGFDIPIYVMGYDTQGRSVRHVHYVRWNNTEDERTSLETMRHRAGGGNFDAYSLKYIYEQIMQPMTTDYKLLVNISDGLPSEGFSNDCVEDVKQVVDSIKENEGTYVVGICIDKTQCQRPDFPRMYGDSFCDGSDIEALPDIFAESLVNTVENFK